MKSLNLEKNVCLLVLRLWQAKRNKWSSISTNQNVQMWISLQILRYAKAPGRGSVTETPEAWKTKDIEIYLLFGRTEVIHGSSRLCSQQLVNSGIFQMFKSDKQLQRLV